MLPHCSELLPTSPYHKQPLLCSSSLHFCLFQNVIKIKSYMTLSLASFTEHNTFEIHPCCCVCQQFIPLYYRGVFHCMDVPWFIHPPVEGFFFLVFFFYTVQILVFNFLFLISFQIYRELQRCYREFSYPLLSFPYITMGHPSTLRIDQ